MKPLHFSHTTAVSNRRRALFPEEGNTSSSDLECVKSLSSDTESEDELKSYRQNSSISDYDIIGIVDNQLSEKDCTPQNIKPFTLKSSKLTPTSQIETPTQKLKTPHETSTQTKVPKLTRKSTSDPIPNIEFDHFSPENKENIPYSINPKIRTALFPESTMALSPKNFYPKLNNCASPRPVVKRIIHNRRFNYRKQTLYLCNRKHSRTSQINAGVRHGIKKPKRLKKKYDNDLYLKAAINIIENSPLNDYLEDANLLNQNAAKPMIEPARDLIKPNYTTEKPQIPQISRSPTPEPDPTKKFFKSSAKQKSIITVNKNLKFEVNNGRLSLIEHKKSMKRPRNTTFDSTISKRLKITPDPTDFQDDEEDYSESEMTTTNISQLLNILDDKENEIQSSSNGDILSQNPDILMSPTSQMCDMTSGLAINSPKKNRNLIGILNSLPSSSSSSSSPVAVDENEPKMYPIFYPGKVQKSENERKLDSQKTIKKFKITSNDQMLLDAGQKKFGITQCIECQFIYHIGDPSDEIIHLNYHNSGHILRFNGWKNERIVSSDLTEGKIIQVVQSDPKVWWKKISELMEVINKDLGFFDAHMNLDNSQVFIYVKNKLIVGVLVAQAQTTAYRLLTSHFDNIDLCSEESFPVKCGVSRIWVSQNYRKSGVATALMDALRRNFMFGCILKLEEIAFSSPTEMGKLFGERYFKTPNFLIYYA